MMKPKPNDLKGVLISASVGLMLAFGAAAKSKVEPMPTDNARSYSALSDGTSSTLGNTMKLSRTAASFSKLKGELKLQYSDVWNNGTIRTTAETHTRSSTQTRSSRKTRAKMAFAMSRCDGWA